VIHKEPYRKRDANPDNPYHVALGFGLEREFYFLRSQSAAEQQTHIIVERRGRICDGGNSHGHKLPFDVVFTDKKSNSAGLQMADLVARPVGI